MIESSTEKSEGDKYEVFVEKNQNSQLVSLSPIETFQPENNIKNNNINSSNQNIEDHKYPICSNNPYNNIISDDGSEDYVVNEYKKYQTFVKAYLEDPIIRASNLNDYDELSNIGNIGKIDLKNGEDQPKPNGYIFQSSPAYLR